MTPSFTVGSIIRVKDYEFEDGSTRDKYLIVLFRNNTEAYIINSLVTSKNKLHLSGLQHGCNVSEHNGLKIPYFFFPENIVLDTATGFFFDMDSFVFFRTNVFKASIAQLLQKYSNTPFGIIELGNLGTSELKRLLKCLLKSTFISNDIKILLTTFKDTL